jgi:hypothetical protein
VNQFQSNGQHNPGEVMQALLAEAKPFVYSINATPLDLALIKAEMQRVRIPKVLAEQLAKQLAPRLGVTTSTLREIITIRRRKPRAETGDAQQTEPKQESSPSETTLQLPSIEMPEDNRYVSEFALKLANILAPHEVFQRFNRCVVPRKDEQDRISLTEVDAQEFRTLIESYCSPYYRRRRKGAGGQIEIVRRSLSVENAKGTLVSRELLEGLRPIQAFNRVCLPMIDRDGKLRLLPKGYDGTSKIYTAQNALDYPSNTSLEDARKFFDDLLSEFCFLANDKKRAKSVLIAAAETLYVRHLLSSNSVRPNFLTSANAEGSGKTLLCKIPIIAIQGSAPATTVPNDEAEMRKLIGAIALSGSPVFFLDNIKGHLSSSALDALTTSPETEFRLLGQNKIIDAEHGLTVFLTGNHATSDPDLRRRTLIIELFMAESRPEDRIIQHPLDDAKLIEKRPEILGALWAFVRHWDTKGRPKPRYVNQSFLMWSEVVGGILEACGYEPPKPAPVGGSDGDRQLLDMEKLVQNLVIGTEYTFSDLVEKSRELHLFDWIVGDSGDLEAKERSMFGKLLKRFTGRTFFLEDYSEAPTIVKFKLSAPTARKKYFVEAIYHEKGGWTFSR